MRHPDAGPVSAPVGGSYSSSEICPAGRVRGAENRGARDGLSSRRVRPASAQLLPRLGSRQLRRSSNLKTLLKSLRQKEARRGVLSSAARESSYSPQIPG